MTRETPHRAEQWAWEQSKALMLDLPGRQPGEAPALESQLLRIRALVRGADLAELAHLGQQQAETLIGRLHAERDAFTMEKVAEWLGGPAPSEPAQSPGQPRPAILPDLLIAAAIVLLILRWFSGSWSGLWELFR